MSANNSTIYKSRILYTPFTLPVSPGLISFHFNSFRLFKCFLLFLLPRICHVLLQFPSHLLLHLLTTESRQITKNLNSLIYICRQLQHIKRARHVHTAGSTFCTCVCPSSQLAIQLDGKYIVSGYDIIIMPTIIFALPQGSLSKVGQIKSFALPMCRDRAEIVHTVLFPLINFII